MRFDTIDKELGLKFYLGHRTVLTATGISYIGEEEELDPDVSDTITRWRSCFESIGHLKVLICDTAGRDADAVLVVTGLGRDSIMTTRVARENAKYWLDKRWNESEGIWGHPTIIRDVYHNPYLEVDEDTTTDEDDMEDMRYDED